MVVICDHSANAPGGLAAERDDAAAVARNVVPDQNVLGGTIDAQSVRIATGLQADVIVVIINVAILHQHVIGRVDVHAISAGTRVVGNPDAIHRHVIRVNNLHCPET